METLCFPSLTSRRESDAPSPLAERMRPRTFDEFVGQEELLAPGKPLRQAIERDLLQSIILWGPPGTGKTTLARIIADLTQARFVSFSAVLSGIKEIREVMTRSGADAPDHGPPHDRVHRRDPPLQQGAAGRLSAARREGRHRAHRRDDREPVVRGQRGAAVAIEGVRASRALGGGSRTDSSPRADRSRPRAGRPARGRRGRGAARRSPSTRTAMPAWRSTCSS